MSKHVFWMYKKMDGHKMLAFMNLWNILNLDKQKDSQNFMHIYSVYTILFRIYLKGKLRWRLVVIRDEASNKFIGG